MFNKEEKKISYSTIIDDYPRVNPLIIDNHVRLVDQRKLYFWVSNNEVSNCYICGNTFSLFVRKHHCRACGRIFCYDCCSNFIPTSEIKNKPIEDSSWLTYIWNNDKSKVCLNCFRSYNKLKKSK